MFYPILTDLKNTSRAIKCSSLLGIRIHSGNTSSDTEGCILVGQNLVKGKVLNSRATYNKLLELLEKDKDNLIIEVK